ncbi:glycosyltransferase family 2 protein [Lichenicoccus roseus]|uniref:Glycosyltransferase n=1 Tax=Lichenicoccus roseus TaxID=2683649 RepID=A0A5R9JAS1_9PROT|nr:glycosyltransferase [Lichenicoccus roseus]TLU72701.1 glycosyltransferase [Lichenicoccus roseus]
MDGGGASATAGTACFGRADPVESALVTGWLVAPGDGVVDAFIDGEGAGSAMVSSGSGDAALADGTRRFSYQIPWNFQDGRSHVLSLVLGDGTAIECPTRGGVTRSNIRFRFEQPPDTQARGKDLDQERRVAADAGQDGNAGLADPLSGSIITGWAVSRQAPEETVRLRVFVDGNAAGIAACDRPHRALRALGLPNEIGGFEFEIGRRYIDGLTHSLVILFEDGSTLPFLDAQGKTRNTIDFTIRPLTSIAGVVDGLHGDSIKGWAARRDLQTGDLEGRLRIEVLCNGIGVSEIVADLPRLDVARENRCDPAVGFEFRLPAQCRSGVEFEFVFRVLPDGQELAGSPLVVKHRPTENEGELRSLMETVEDLCAKTFKLQRQLHAMLPVSDATIDNYDGWARRNLARLRSRVAGAATPCDDPPLVSIVMPVHRANLAYLTAAIASVCAQTYLNWELIIVDDGSRQTALSACLRTYSAADPRIVCVLGRQHRGIGAASNVALRRALGAYVVMFGQEDLMVDVALEEMVREALRTGAKVLYSDEDAIDEFGGLSEPKLKPDWNYRLLLGNNYIGSLLMIDRPLLMRADLLRTNYDGAQEHDLLLRLWEACEPGQIGHLAEILSHRRTGSVLSTRQPEAIEAGRRAVADHLVRRGFAASGVAAHRGGAGYRINWGYAEEPSVTIIVPFKDQVATTRRCLERLLKNTRWRDWRIVLVDNGSVTPAAAEFCLEAALDPHVVVRQVREAFNYARLNNMMVREFTSEFYVFLNNDVFVQQPDWLHILVGEAMADPRAAIVGAKLLYPNGTVQHAGVILGVGGIADHAFRGLPADHGGYLGRARCAQRYSAVTGACMLCRSEAFLEAGGFDERELKVTFNDVDLCLKVAALGWHVLWTPDMVAEHHESLSRGDDISAGKAPRFFYENQVMLERWGDQLTVDPFYNPHFSRDHGIFSDLR